MEKFTFKIMSQEKKDKKVSIDILKNNVNEYIRERDWKKYHRPKDLAMSMAIESSELMEIFQWEDKKSIQKMLDDKNEMEKIRDEIADITIYILSFCNETEIDLSSAVLNKIKKVKEKYPKEKVLDNEIYKKDNL